MTTAYRPLKNALTSTRLWHVVDGAGQIVGRLANQIAIILQGKHKPVYNPAQCVGDNVVVLNASKLVLTNDKWKKTYYRWHTGYPGGLKEVQAGKEFQKHPERILRRAVYGMLPRNRLRRERMTRLMVFPGTEHPYRGMLNPQTLPPKPIIESTARTTPPIPFEAYQRRGTLELDPNEGLVIKTEVINSKPRKPGKISRGYFSKHFTPYINKLDGPRLKRPRTISARKIQLVRRKR